MFKLALACLLVVAAAKVVKNDKVRGVIATAADAHTAGLDFVYVGDLVPESASVGFANYAVHEHFDKSDKLQPWKSGFNIAGKHYKNGVFAHAPSNVKFDLENRYSLFHACVGLDDAAGDNGNGVEFRVVMDGKVVWKKYLYSRSLARRPHASTSLSVVCATSNSLVTTSR